jgi:hypothetical protein
MLTALHIKKNRLYLRIILFVMLLSWIALTVMTTCTMPLRMATLTSDMSGCSNNHVSDHTHHQGQDHMNMQDCAFKPCLSTQSDSFSDFNRLQPELPVFILCLVATLWSLFLYFPITQALFIADPPTGRRIQLIYRFCKLLN